MNFLQNFAAKNSDAIFRKSTDSTQSKIYDDKYPYRYELYDYNTVGLKRSFIKKWMLSVKKHLLQRMYAWRIQIPCGGLITRITTSHINCLENNLHRRIKLMLGFESWARATYAAKVNNQTPYCQYYWWNNLFLKDHFIQWIYWIFGLKTYCHIILVTVFNRYAAKSRMLTALFLKKSSASAASLQKCSDAALRPNTNLPLILLTHFNTFFLVD